jgi:hypothetical protein
MIKKCFTLLIFPLFSIAVAFTSSCSPPIGGLLHGSAPVDYIRAAPSRVLYDLRNWFRPADPNEGVQVYGVFGGVEELIDIEKVEIKVIDDPDIANAEVELPVHNKQEGIPLLSKGVKTVVISYDGMETRYPIVVGEPGTSGWFEQDGTGSGIQIIWKK